jgi:hypothetical protein
MEILLNLNWFLYYTEKKTYSRVPNLNHFPYEAGLNLCRGISNKSGAPSGFDPGLKISNGYFSKYLGKVSNSTQIRNLRVAEYKW